MAIDFPDSPSLNDTYVAGGKTYKWDGTAWEIYGPNVSPGTFKIDDVNNRVGIGTATPQYSLHVDGDVGFNDAATANFFVSSGTGANVLPAGTTAERPASPSAGMIRYNSTTDAGELYNAAYGNWVPFANQQNDGSTSLLAITQGDELSTYATTDGVYYIKTASMATAVQCYVDATTHTEPMIRIFLANTNNYIAGTSAYDVADIASDCKEFVYAFCNISTNALAQAWTWRFSDTSRVSTSAATNASAFKTTNPTTHGSVGSPLITQVVATSISTGTSITTYLRTGICSFSSNCDDGRTGDWGQICLKAGNTSSVGSGGYSDFPHYASFYDAAADHCSQSDQAYNATGCSDTRRFAIYVTL